MKFTTSVSFAYTNTNIPVYKNYQRKCFPSPPANLLKPFRDAPSKNQLLAQTNLSLFWCCFRSLAGIPRKLAKCFKPYPVNGPYKKRPRSQNWLPLQPVDEPVAEENDVEAAPEIRLQKQMNIQEPDHGDIYQSLSSTSLPQSPSYTSDLFDDFPVDWVSAWEAERGVR